MLMNINPASASTLQTPKAVPPTVSYPAISTSSINNTSCTRNNPFLASFASQLSPHGVNETLPTIAAATGVCRDPLCRDPLCPTALRNQQFLGAAAGNGYSYASLLASSPHYREAMMVMAAQHRMMASMSATSPHTNGSLPHVCGWMLGNYLILAYTYSFN